MLRCVLFYMEECPLIMFQDEECLEECLYDMMEIIGKSSFNTQVLNEPINNFLKFSCRLLVPP